MRYTRQVLASLENLELAWLRIQTSTGRDYKDLCRESYLAFSWNLNKNLNLLSHEINERIYVPSKASKYYLPKKTNLVRPITLLSVKDQIFYQAVVNLICDHKINIIREFRGTNVFGGMNLENPKDKFFLARWKREYSAYKDQIKRAFKERYNWIGKFDLASFYDLIDHKILIEVSSQSSLDSELECEFYQALKAWSQPQAIDFCHSHGIPQGPCASTVLADIYLHMLDRKIISILPRHQIKYFRYVDDIVLMGKEEDSVELGLIKLDIAARELALVPQSRKTLSRKVDNIESELKGENSLFDFFERNNKKKINQQDKLKDIFLESIKIKEGDKLEILDHTNVKYALYRLLPDPDISALVLRIINSYSHITDLCIKYLNQQDLDKYISKYILEKIRSCPNHDWHTAQLFKLFSRLDKDHQAELILLSVSLIEDNYKHWILKCSTIEIIKGSPEASTFLLEVLRKNLQFQVLEKELPFYISLLKVCLELNFSFALDLIKDFIDRRGEVGLSDDACIFLGYYASRFDLNLPQELKNNIWIRSGLYLDEEGSSTFDGISHNLVVLFKMPDKLKQLIDFKDYLGDEEFEEALEKLCLARGFFEREPETFIECIDSFNQILLFAFHKRSDNHVPAHELFNMIGKMKNILPNAYPGLNFCHEKRCSVSRVHAYDKNTNSLNRRLKKPFDVRNKIRKELALSYEYILEYISREHLVRINLPVYLRS